MPRCEITGIAQIITMECLHPKYQGKQAGFLFCSEGLTAEKGIAVNKGACPCYIEGTGTNDVWCKLRKEKIKNDRINREIKKNCRKR